MLLCCPTWYIVARFGILLYEWHDNFVGNPGLMYKTTHEETPKTFTLNSVGYFRIRSVTLENDLSNFFRHNKDRIFEKKF